MKMRKDVEDDGDNVEEEMREALMRNAESGSKKQQPWMVYLSTIVAVCGSYEFGSCVSASYIFCINSKSLNTKWVFNYFIY